MNKINSVMLGSIMALSLAACNTTEPELLDETAATPSAAATPVMVAPVPVPVPVPVAAAAGAYGDSGAAGQTGVGVTNGADSRTVNPGTAAPPPVTREPDTRTTVPTPVGG